jgi:predicted RNase H-like HicB family nuclease
MKYAITLEKDEDGFIVASCPALPGCHSQGRTKAEAIANIQEAIRGYLASKRKHGEAFKHC